ncbi:hypothetical protein Z957_11470 [Clostridium sp. K25]|uniref:pilus assembly protein PilM n=1 Tax=Clostridium sp. K25 TaxID=1443109 RepID=UPI0004DA4E5D|nr:pilus assembly protein PilM [Clostridium sp. K25]KEI06486.1 hypothetical protein Z957_11470 [Clostridium sp. K25]
MFFKNILCFDIGNKNIKIVLGRVKNNIVKVDKCIMVSCKREYIKDGEIINFKNLKEIISETIISNNILEKEVYCTINSSRIIQRNIIVPKANNKELNTLINFEVEEHIPIKIDNYVVQYKVLEEVENENINKLKILVAMCPKELIERYFKLFRTLVKAEIVSIKFIYMEEIQILQG